MGKRLPDDLPKALQDKDLPDVLLPYQSDLLATTAINQVVFCEKSRRIGITWGIGADAVLTAASGRDAKGMDVFYIGYNLEMARDFIQVCGAWAKAFNQACHEVEEFVFEEADENGDTKEIKAFRIEFASGFEILALPSRPRSLRGKQGYVILDEAAFHDDLKEVLKAAYALLMWGGKVLVISTHDGVDNPFNQEIQAIREGRKGYRNHKLIRITFEDALRDGLYKRICLCMGQEWSPKAEKEWSESIYEFYGDAGKEELDVVPARGGGKYLPAQIVEPNMRDDIPVIKYKQDDKFFHKPIEYREEIIQDFCRSQIEPHINQMDRSCQTYFGQDFARKGDLSSLAPLQIMENTRRKVPFYVELQNLPFACQRQVLFFILDRVPRFSGAAFDGTGNGAQIAEECIDRYGELLVNSIHMTNNYYLESFPKYKSALEDNMILIPKHADILADHRVVVIENGIPHIPKAKNKSEDGSQRHGDSVSALVNAYWVSCQDVHSYEYSSSAKREKANFMKPPSGLTDVKFNTRFERGCF